MNENEMLQDDEISLFDLWEKLREGWLVVVGGAMLGIAGAVLAIVLIPPKYEAVAVVQVGQIGQIGQIVALGEMQRNRSVQLAQPVESAVQAVERMKITAFQSRVSERAGVVGQLIPQVIKATATEQFPLIELKVIGSNPEYLQKIAGAAIAELASSEESLVRPQIELLQGELRIAEEKQAKLNKEVSDLVKLIVVGASNEGRANQPVLLTTLKIQKEHELAGQRQLILATQAALARTRPAQALEAISVGQAPISPKKNLLLALGAIGGLLAGALWVFMADAWRRARERRAARPKY